MQIRLMSAATAKLLSEFETLGTEEKQEFVREIMHHLPQWDSGPSATMSPPSLATNWHR
jgi:hypothetical protein